MLEAMIVHMEDNMMGETKEIIDSTGNVLNKKKENKTITFLKENVWNIIGGGLPAAISLISGLNLIVSKSFANSCAEYYGINREYFSENGIFEEQMLVLACALILFIYPFVFSYLTKNEKSKIYVIIIGIATAMILFMQSLVYTVNLIDIISYDWLRQIFDNYFVVIGLLVVDIVIAYFVIIRRAFVSKKRLNLFERIIFSFALGIYALNVTAGIVVKLDYQIDDKKTYEVIEQNKAVVAIYNEKFVVIDCEIDGETIILEKGKYSLQEMTGVSITYHEYKNVEFR